MARKTAIYARTSTSGQEERHTIESQLTDCRDYCETKGYPIVGEFVDDGVSGAIPLEERPQGHALLEAARQKQFDCVVIYCADRLGRDALEALLALEKFKELHLNVEFKVQSFDATPEGKFQFTVMMAVAELERALIARRTAGGRRRVAKEGKHMASHAPYGYQVDPKTKQLSPHPWQASIVQWMFRESATDKGAYAIATKLNDLGILPPRLGRKYDEWASSGVHQLLTNPRYIGQGSYGGVEVAYPRLIDDETFQRVQAGFQRRRGAPHESKVVYLLRHRIFCRRCGARMKGITRGDHAYYVCRNRRERGEKRAPHGDAKWSVRADVLEAVIKQRLVELMTAPEYLLGSAEFYEERAGQLTETQTDDKAQFKARLEELDRQEERLVGLIQDGLGGDKTRRHLKEIEIERRTVGTQLETCQHQPVDTESLAERLRSWAGGYRNLADMMTFLQQSYPGVDYAGTESVLDDLADSSEEWQWLIRELIETVWLEEDGSITVEGHMELEEADETCADGVHCPGTTVNGVEDSQCVPPLTSSRRERWPWP